MEGIKTFVPSIIFKSNEFTSIKSVKKLSLSSSQFEFLNFAK